MIEVFLILYMRKDKGREKIKLTDYIALCHADAAEVAADTPQSARKLAFNP